MRTFPSSPSAFQTGANQWRTFDAWPPKAARRTPIYLHENGQLAYARLAATNARDTYVGDPARSVPYTSTLSFGYYLLHPIEDQRFASQRPDVLVYQTTVLDQDLTLAGPIGANVHGASTGTDADFIVKVMDVWPDVPLASRDGYELLVKGDVSRTRWRRSPREADPVDARQAGLRTVHAARRLSHLQEATPLDGARAEHLVPAHRPQSADVRAEHQHGGHQRLRAATMTVFRSSTKSSHLVLPVLP